MCACQKLLSRARSRCALPLFALEQTEAHTFCLSLAASCPQMSLLSNLPIYNKDNFKEVANRKNTSNFSMVRVYGLVYEVCVCVHMPIHDCLGRLLACLRDDQSLGAKRSFWMSFSARNRPLLIGPVMKGQYPPSINRLSLKRPPY